MCPVRLKVRRDCHLNRAIEDVVVTATPGVLSTATGPRGGATATTSAYRTEAAWFTSEVGVGTGLIQRVTVAHFVIAKTQPSMYAATPSVGCIRQIA